MIFISLLLYLSIFIAFASRHGHVRAQFIQGYTWQSTPSPGGYVVQVPFWRPTIASTPSQVVFLDPETVYLEYNCYYMRDICENARAFFRSPRGQSRTPRTLFGYDFSTGRSGRGRKRREKSCPTGKRGWASFHTCPERNQGIVMRHDGVWPYKDLEPNTPMNNIRNQRDAQGQVTEYSRIRYSCDEFPPASWVEGGSGSPSPESSPMDAFTRCAAIRCGKGRNGVKAIPSDSRLRQELTRLADRRHKNNKQFPFYDPNDSIVLFFFRFGHERNGTAARVITYADPGLTSLEQPEIKITQAKRSAHNYTHTDMERYLQWADTVSLDDLIASGYAYEQLVLANDTLDDAITTTMPSMGMLGMEMGMGGFDMDLTGSLDGTWLDEDGIDEDDIQDEESYNTSNRVVLPFVKRTSEPIVHPVIVNTTNSQLEKARDIVEAALTLSVQLNGARLANPLRNKYVLKPSSVGKSPKVGKRDRGDPEQEAHGVWPLLHITDEIMNAAALVSEADALDDPNTSRMRVAAVSGTYWMQNIERKGTVPWGDNPQYKIFRNVRDYGAIGDGITDDTKAIKLAMNDTQRCGAKCNGSTTKNAIVYFPPGTYRVSTSIPMPFGTQVIGDANNWPTISASPAFIGLGVLSTDEYTGGGKGSDGQDQEWYINTANFYRQMRNIRIDITQTRSAQQVACVHYQVAQATSMQNVELIMKVGTKQRGIFAENGSGGMISDVTFRGGSYGIYAGNQQFTAQRLTFDGCVTGVQVFWDWGWIWKSITMTNVDVGFRLVQENSTKTTATSSNATNGNIGSASFIDSSFQGVGTAILITPVSEQTGSGSTGVILENVKFQSVTKAVADTRGSILLSPSGFVDHWALGPVYSPGRTFSTGGRVGNYRRQQPLLNNNGGYFERAKPQYEDRSVSDFVHVKDFGAQGDGATDDTAAVQSALWASQGKILFVDAGSYILTSTVTIPPGSKILGETWSQLVASGSFFSDPRNPKVMIKVGNDGDVGKVEMQDLLFTNIGPTAGLVLVEWNIKAENPGSAALWDCHARIGGAIGTKLTPTECPPLTSGIAPGCNAASLIMHLTPKSSGYFENMWLWVSDHMIDDPDWTDANNTMVQNSVYVARGLLVESVEPTWLYGTSAEHSVFYQYNFNNARNVFAGMIQTESPYYQPTPPPPSPFQDSVGVFDGDPDYSCKGGSDFNGCDESWGVIIRGCSNVFIAGAGVYSWFSTYAQDCIDGQACQKGLMLVEKNVVNVRIQQLITIGAKYSVVHDGTGILALDNLNVKGHPRWSQISVLDFGDNGTDSQEILWIDPKIWDMETPSFTCSPPCRVKLPPWTGATSTIDYPIMTINDDSWVTTMTVAPITVSQWIFEVVTLQNGAGNLHRRQGFTDFWPKPATRPQWPSVTYTNPAGVTLTAAPSVPFPKFPDSLGPNAPAPPQGSWPKKPMHPVAGLVDYPIVRECSFADPSCLQDPWIYGPMGPPGPYFGEPTNDEYATICPEDSTTTSSTTSTSSTPSKTEPTKTTAVVTETPEPSPIEHGNPATNTKECYGSGRRATHDQLQNAITSFCNELGKPGTILPEKTIIEVNKDVDASGANPVALRIVLELDISEKCEWVWNFDECSHYLDVPVDSCNCNGKDAKQGGIVDNNCLKWRIDPNNKWT